MKTVFYFDFYFDDGSDDGITTVYAFNMELDSTSTLIDDNDESFEDAMFELESEYGVHDWSTRPVDELVGIGYTSYEVDPSKYVELMDKWLAYFTSRSDVKNVTSVVRIDVDTEGCNDLDIYNLVNDKI